MTKNSESPIIILDGDNTLWGWLEYAVPAYEAMSEVIAKIAGKSVPETVEAMKAFYTLVGSIENEGLIQGLHSSGFFREVKDFDEAETISITLETFARVQSENLKLYEGIPEAIDEISSMEMEMVLVSDAPIHKARARLQDLGLLDKVPLTFGMPSAKVPRRPKSRPRPPIHPDMILRKEKPHNGPELALKLALTQEEFASRIKIVGDNDAKDMGFARKNGTVGFHSLWGAADPKLVERILKFAPARVAKRHMQVGKDAKAATGSRIIPVNKPDEVVKILRGY